MRIAELEELIRTSLTSLGADEADRAAGVLRFTLNEGLAGRFGRSELAVTFRPAVAAHHPEVELISAGSFMYDLILRLVRERGRAATGWLPADPAVDPVARVRKAAPRLAGRNFLPARDGWGTVYLFTFRLGFYFDMPHEKLYTVRVDYEQGRVRHDVHPWRLVNAAGPPPPEAAEPPSGAEPEKAFKMAWVKVEEEVSRLAERYRTQGQAALEEEVRTIETYYRQLIEEEKGIREARVSKKGREESEAKIEMLKLEWDRRVVEEKRRMSPDVKVSLSCALKLMVPLVRLKARSGPGRKEPAAEFWVDLHSGEAWPVRRKKKAGARRLKGEGDSGILSRPTETDEPCTEEGSA